MRILSEADYDTFCAHSLQEGKKKWDELDPVIVILDHNLPDGTGLDLIEANEYLLKKSLIVFITADTHEETKTRADRLGVTEFMFKPFSITDIRDVEKPSRTGPKCGAVHRIPAGDEGFQKLFEVPFSSASPMALARLFLINFAFFMVYLKPKQGFGLTLDKRKNFD